MKSHKPAVKARRWLGREAGLRPRLVLIVGIAMLAPGALAVLQAVAAFRSSARIVEENLAQSAQLAANDKANTISASQEILTSLAMNPDVRLRQGAACRRALQRAIAGLDQYSGAAVLDEQGTLSCSSSPMKSLISEADRSWFRDVMTGDSFVVSDVLKSRWLDSWGMVAAVPLVNDQGVIQGAVSLFIDLEGLTRRYERATESDQAVLLDGKGDLITAINDQSRVRPSLPSDDMIKANLQRTTQTFTTKGQDGVSRLYVISPLLEGRIFVILGQPLLVAMGPLALQVAWGVLAPLLMWALAIAVVWFGIEHLVVRWISYLERVTSAYAAGRQAVRPERVSAAPAEIRSLGETFARMADLISAREHQLRESLAQKEVLVREIHHRVKNNLQLVMSLLNLHARRIRDPRAEAAFADARSRINALATLHRRLYESENLQQVEVRWFLEDLCVELRRGGLPGNRDIDLTVQAPDEVIGPEIAVPLGLLVTEAITNAYKHAFKARSDGRIEVRVKRESDTLLSVTVHDNGIGFDLTAAAEGNGGLGRPLIDAFVRQLHGELSIQTDDGTALQVKFPLPLSRPRETEPASKQESRSA
jgi:two-component sensor histidine kinase